MEVNNANHQIEKNEKNSFSDNELDLLKDIEADAQKAGGVLKLPNDSRVGVTMFDAGSSKDNLVTIVVPKKDLAKVPSQALVRIESARPEDGGDGRSYQGIVVQGPFYEPDGLKADSAIIITTAAQGVTFMPKYHGRVIVEILGEVIGDTTIPPRFRPLPNSPVYLLTLEEAKEALKLSGDIVLGTAIGHTDMEVKIPSDKKAVLFRHLGVLGTTGGGKSTTISGMVNHFQQSNLATILVDTEGEYTYIDKQTDDKNMLLALNRRGLTAGGVKNTQILRLIGRETTNSKHPCIKDFTLHFHQLSPYSVIEVLDLPEAQQQRYLKAYDIAKSVLRSLKIFPATRDEEAQLYELDELQTGYPRLTLATMYDIINLCQRKVGKEDLGDKTNGYNFKLQSIQLKGHEEDVLKAIHSEKDLPGNVFSWRALQGVLSRFLRLNIFDNLSAKPFDFKDLTSPGKVTIIDLSDTDSPAIRNLVIADLLKGLMEHQNQYYVLINDEQDNNNSLENEVKNVPRVMVILEEAHEFLSVQRIKQMPTLYDQVARIAKRGRKRWLGLTFVTQLPQHLPDEVLALINNFILHKISDATVISRLKKSIGSVDESLWNKLTSLSSGQAVVTFSHMKRAMLTAVDPTPCKLLMVE